MTSGAKMRRKTLSIFWIPEGNVLHTWHCKYAPTVAIMLQSVRISDTQFPKNTSIVNAIFVPTLKELIYKYISAIVQQV